MSKEVYRRVYLTEEQISFLYEGINWYGQFIGSGDEDTYEIIGQDCVEAFIEAGWEEPE